MKWKAYWNRHPRVQDPDPCRQVGRTFRGRTYSAPEIDLVVRRILWLLEADRAKNLLDIACGNGMITSRIAPHFGRICGVDFSAPLIAVARRDFHAPNVEYVVGDALELSAGRNQYDCVLIGLAFQYFSTRQADRLLRRVRSCLKDDGRVVLGDVADRDRMWNFYRGWGGRLRYLWDVVRRRPIVGHWWSPADLTKLAKANGMSVEVCYQTPAWPNHYFRYDAVLRLRRNVPVRN